MKNKTNWYLKVIKHFYGVRGELDEYRIQEINRVGNNAFMFIQFIWPISILLIVFLPYFVSSINATLILMAFNVLTYIFVMFYVSWSISQLKLAEVDSYDEKDYQSWVKKTLHKSMLVGLNFFFAGRIFQILFNMVNGDSFVSSVLSIRNNLITLIGSIFIVIIGYNSMKKKIKKP